MKWIQKKRQETVQIETGVKKRLNILLTQEIHFVNVKSSVPDLEPGSIKVLFGPPGSGPQIINPANEEKSRIQIRTENVADLGVEA
jgi:hypothetical protein